MITWKIVRITYLHRHKGVASDWFGNGVQTAITGKVDMIQESEFSGSSIQINLTGLERQAGKYAIYKVPRQLYSKLKCEHFLLFFFY